MDDVKLPDLSRVRGNKDTPKQLPPQKSAADTSNWENRHFSAPAIAIDREFEFIADEPDPIVNPYLLQEARKGKFPSKDIPD